MLNLKSNFSTMILGGYKKQKGYIKFCYFKISYFKISMRNEIVVISLAVKIQEQYYDDKQI